MYGLLIYDDAGLSRNEWFIDRLISYAKTRGEELRVTRASELFFGSENGKLFFSFPDGISPDYAIVRTVFPLLSECLEAYGVRVFNSSRVSRIANDKRAAHAFLAGLNIPSAKTFFTCAHTFDPTLYQYPLILKSAAGHGGNEVFYVENPKSAADAVEKIKGSDFLLQEIVDKGRDVRVYLLGEKILAAVERTSRTDFRSNFSLGGDCALYEPNERMKEIVEAVRKALCPTFIGVDFTFRDGVPLLNEIEDVVGARMLYKRTDLAVHELFFDEIMKEMNGV